MYLMSLIKFYSDISWGELNSWSCNGNKNFNGTTRKDIGQGTEGGSIGDRT